MKITIGVLNVKVRVMNAIDKVHVYGLHYAYSKVALMRDSDMVFGYSTKRELVALMDAYYKGILNERERIVEALK